MRAIVAIIKPHKLDEVTEALHNLGVQGMTITEVRGHGRQRGHSEVYRGTEYTVEFIPKVRLDVVVDDVDADGVADASPRRPAPARSATERSGSLPSTPP